jgi:hypothetical protein
LQKWNTAYHFRVVDCFAAQQIKRCYLVMEVAVKNFRLPDSACQFERNSAGWFDIGRNRQIATATNRP